MSRLEIALSDPFVDRAVEAIKKSARHGTGDKGDGTTFLMPLERVVRISTGEEGTEAISGDVGVQR